WARENAVLKHDHGLLLSGALVFIALHLGWFDLEVLNKYRNEIYERTVAGEMWVHPCSELESIVCDLNHLLLSQTSLNLLNLRAFSSEWSHKLASRLEYLKNKNTNFMHPSVSIFGEGGFAA